MLCGALGSMPRSQAVLEVEFPDWGSPVVAPLVELVHAPPSGSGCVVNVHGLSFSCLWMLIYVAVWFVDISPPPLPYNDPYTEFDYRERKLVDILATADPLNTLSKREKRLLWTSRNHLVNNPPALPQVMQRYWAKVVITWSVCAYQSLMRWLSPSFDSVDWSSPEMRQEAYRLLYLWKKSANHM